MQPTDQHVFVKEVKKDQSGEFKVTQPEIHYEVTHVADDVDGIEVGDTILFSSSQTHQYKGETITIVHEDEILGVEHV